MQPAASGCCAHPSVSLYLLPFTATRQSQQETRACGKGPCMLQAFKQGGFTYGAQLRPAAFSPLRQPLSYSPASPEAFWDQLNRDLCYAVSYSPEGGSTYGGAASLNGHDLSACHQRPMRLLDAVRECPAGALCSTAAVPCRRSQWP